MLGVCSRTTTPVVSTLEYALLLPIRGRGRIPYSRQVALLASLSYNAPDRTGRNSLLVFCSYMNPNEAFVVVLVRYALILLLFEAAREVLHMMPAKY